MGIFPLYTMQIYLVDDKPVGYKILHESNNCHENVERIDIDNYKYVETSGGDKYIFVDDGDKDFLIKANNVVWYETDK